VIVSSKAFKLSWQKFLETFVRNFDEIFLAATLLIAVPIVVLEDFNNRLGYTNSKSIIWRVKKKIVALGAITF